MWKRITRSRSRRDQACSSSQAPNPPRRREVDSDSDPDDSDGEYDPAAQQLENELGFQIPDRRMLKQIQSLRKRSFENTRMIDMETLEKLGVAREITYLMRKVGFTRKFFKFHYKANKLLTLEFLSSLRLKQKPNGNYYIKFRLGNEKRYLYITGLAELMGFETDFSVDETKFRDGWDRDTFWKHITGLSVGRDYKANLIPHPTIRILHRVLAATIFARGETVSRCNSEDLALIDHMLRPKATKINLALLMVRNWIRVRDQSRGGGFISMGGYVTRLAKKFRIDFSTSDKCKGPDLLTPQLFENARFLKVMKNIGGRDRYLWLTDQGHTFYLPYTRPIEVSQPSTWLISFTGRQSDSSGEESEEERPHATPHADSPDRMPAWTGPYAPSFQPGPSFSGHEQSPQGSDIPQQQPQWFNEFVGMFGNLHAMNISQSDEIRELRRISEDNSQQMGTCIGELRRLDQRLSTVEDNQYGQNFFFKHGYWMGGDDDPNLHPPRHSLQHPPPRHSMQHQPPRHSVQQQPPPYDHQQIFPGHDQHPRYPGGPSEGHDFTTD